MVAEAPNGTPPVFLLYYDIVAYFLYRNDSLNNGFFFFGNIVAWFGFEPKIHASKINETCFFHHLDDTKPLCCVSNPL